MNEIFSFPSSLTGKPISVTWDSSGLVYWKYGRMTWKRWMKANKHLYVMQILFDKSQVNFIKAYNTWASNSAKPHPVELY